MSASVIVLAHGGGAPEAAMVGIPLLIIIGFGLLERRARRREAEQAECSAAAEDAMAASEDPHG